MNSTTFRRLFFSFSLVVLTYWLTAWLPPPRCTVLYCTVAPSPQLLACFLVTLLTIRTAATSVFHFLEQLHGNTISAQLSSSAQPQSARHQSRVESQPSHDRQPLPQRRGRPKVVQACRVRAVCALQLSAAAAVSVRSRLRLASSSVLLMYLLYVIVCLYVAAFSSSQYVFLSWSR